jgi:MarR family transcriptional regulator, 2-MHQ and catechol-resistance regulon repressor
MVIILMSSDMAGATAGKDDPMAAAKATTSTPKGVHLWLLLWKATKAQEAHASRSVEEMGLCLSDFGALEALLHKGPLPVNTLGKKILISSGSMTAAIDRLERQGLVERQSSPTDRRARIAHLTAKGTDLIERLFAEHTRDMEQAFSCLDRTEKEILATLLRKVVGQADGPAPLSDRTLSSRKRGES